MFLRGEQVKDAGRIWYLITLLPVIGLVQLGTQAMADRSMYLPLAVCRSPRSGEVPISRFGSGSRSRWRPQSRSRLRLR